MSLTSVTRLKPLHDAICERPLRSTVADSIYCYRVLCLVEVSGTVIPVSRMRGVTRLHVFRELCDYGFSR